jgi:hypothetical protein
MVLIEGVEQYRLLIPASGINPEEWNNKTYKY